MKVVILAGGFGTRLAEETDLRPKPMVDIGGRPILWHIMKIYEASGLTDFVVCCGYKGDLIKRYFSEYYLTSSDITIDLRTGDIEYHQANGEPWRVTLVDTGHNTQTGGRIKRIRNFVANETFALTYGDGLSDVAVSRQVAFHKAHGRHATVMAVPSPGRFGILDIAEGSNVVENFLEKPTREMGWINGGFFVLEPAIFDYIDDDATVWEHEPLRALAAHGQLAAYHHEGFWRPMDTLKDKRDLEAAWQSGAAPWKIW
jgi:glucose-1-phosphate cytidylyltransferase